jgi:hypothetical protein
MGKQAAPYYPGSGRSTKNNYLEIGSYGMHVKRTPNAVTGLRDSSTDFAADFQYDRTIPQFKNVVLYFRGTYIRENSSLLATFAAAGAAQIGHHLNTAQASVEYHFGTKFSGTAGLFDITGTRDPLLFPQAAVSGSVNGSPQSNGYTLNLSWWSEQNVDLAVQYTGYFRFNGARVDYDGAGRDASSKQHGLFAGTICFLIFCKTVESAPERSATSNRLGARLLRLRGSPWRRPTSQFLTWRKNHFP